MRQPAPALHTLILDIAPPPARRPIFGLARAMALTAIVALLLTLSA